MSTLIPDLEAPESILRKVAALIMKAQDSAVSEEERESYFKMADKIASKYAIDLAQLDSKRSKEEREKPTTAIISFPWSHWDTHLSQMLAAICRTVRVKIARTSRGNEFTLVGFQSDVDYVQMVWMSVHLGFMSKLEPRWDTSKIADENIKNLKEAGVSWPTIAQYANMNGFECKANDGRLKAAYRRQCKREGVEPTRHTQRPYAYRESFAAYFRDQVATRLWNMEQARGEQAKSSGAELVLFDRYSAVEDMYFEMFPNLHPDAISLREEEALKREEERRARLTPKEREKEDLDNERMYAKLDRAEQLRRAQRYDANGARAGRQAGASVDLSAGRNGVDPNSTKQIGG